MEAVEYIEQAIARSSKNRGQQLAPTLEMLPHFNRVVQQLFSVAARINPVYFGKTLPVDIVDELRWPFPADVNLIFYLQDQDGNEIAVVPFDDRRAEPAERSVYQLGRSFYKAGKIDDPTAALYFWYSRTPVEVIGLNDDIDASWPEQFNQLVVDELAMYLALKDGRAAEMELLRPERDAWLTLYAAHVEHINALERRRKATVRRFNAESYIPLTQLLTGGTTALQGAA